MDLIDGDSRLLSKLICGQGRAPAQEQLLIFVQRAGLNVPSGQPTFRPRHALHCYLSPAFVITPRRLHTTVEI